MRLEYPNNRHIGSFFLCGFSLRWLHDRLNALSATPFTLPSRSFDVRKPSRFCELPLGKDSNFFVVSIRSLLHRAAYTLPERLFCDCSLGAVFFGLYFRALLFGMPFLYHFPMSLSQECRVHYRLCTSLVCFCNSLLGVQGKP